MKKINNGNNINYDKIKKCYEQELLILKENMNEGNKEEYESKIKLIESVLNNLKG